MVGLVRFMYMGAGAAFVVPLISASMIGLDFGRTICENCGSADYECGGR
jgi:hypothetical protein